VAVTSSRPLSISTSKDAARIAGMFDAIAPRYDALNHLLSAGMDWRWRRRAIRALALTGRERVLDVCTGTGDLAIAAVRQGPRAAAGVVAIDFAAEMLRIGAAKVRRRGLADRIRFARGDATRLPLPDASVDAVTIGFGIRNVSDPAAGCRECLRVLRPGGRLTILEFGAPKSRALRKAYDWYFTVILPRVGRSVSRHDEAYSYLPASVREFPAGDAFGDLLRRQGFTEVRAVPLTFGVVYLYVADKRKE
jgi:demethylmenaquinone methyltransferase / 2-methoxy-6-polyprenyl-1,4-benzoquinol methylase